ncbi:MAG: hypothetical protein KJ620_00655 [Candidatus Edwardsbacteria bacterium]|nr:hypothetical protein [Candidatus Edwardsbacteria bacterium]MBU1576139.1 hypothetical protein [Candidatus Edwardsbacteria bacterium]MBU2463457.1 hypothetical protein [Candidatus Edwardsbacteria bacterium]MBU2593179.1 hypothetical protein [Candidatus Edwardsbacteria bacterium]
MKKVIFITCLLWLNGVLLYAQQTDTTLIKTDTLPKYGTLKVIVLDSDTKEFLPGAMVIPQGFGDTVFTDINGICIIKEVISGNYRLFVKIPTHFILLTDQFKVENNLLTRIKVKLKHDPKAPINQAADDMADNVPMIQRDKTSSYRVYTEEEIKRYPSKP